MGGNRAIEAAVSGPVVVINNAQCCVVKATGTDATRWSTDHCCRIPRRSVGVLVPKTWRFVQAGGWNRSITLWGRSVADDAGTRGIA